APERPAPKAPLPPAPARRVEPAAPRVPRWWPVALAALGAVMLAGGAYFMRPPRHVVAARNGPLVLGVIAIRARDADVPPWLRELTRDALTTTLSKVGALRVYSRQKTDFLREKRQLTEIEAAEQLGMSKMLSATIDVASNNVVLELEIVDIATGMLDASEHV